MLGSVLGGFQGARALCSERAWPVTSYLLGLRVEGVPGVALKRCLECEPCAVDRSCARIISLGGRVVTAQWNMLGHTLEQSAALDAVEQMLALELLRILAQGEPGAAVAKQFAGRPRAQPQRIPGLGRCGVAASSRWPASTAVTGLDDGAFHTCRVKPIHWPTHYKPVQLLRGCRPAKVSMSRIGVPISASTWSGWPMPARSMGNTFDQRLTELVPHSWIAISVPCF